MSEIEIEKQFFETFGINKSTLCKYAIYGYEGEQETWYKCTKRDNECWTYPNESICNDKETDYPEITDHILLELICILTAGHLDEREPYEVTGYNMERLKRQILEDCISLQHRERFKNKVQALFKGE